MPWQSYANSRMWSRGGFAWAAGHAPGLVPSRKSGCTILLTRGSGLSCTDRHARAAAIAWLFVPWSRVLFFTEAEHEVNCKTDRCLGKEWGPITGIWEGYATDPETRFRGASGGVLTALAAYALEVLGMHGVLHSAPGPGRSDPESYAAQSN